MRSLKAIQNEIYQVEQDVKYLRNLLQSPSLNIESEEAILGERIKKVRLLERLYDDEDELIKEKRVK